MQFLIDTRSVIINLDPKFCLSDKLVLLRNQNPPGGTVILSVMTTVITDNTLFGTDLQDAINKRRIVVKTLKSLYYEDGFTQYPMVVDPQGLGYYTVAQSLDAYFGSINAAGFSTTRGFYSTADLRRLGSGRAVNN